jgi:arylsulfatase A-like enzyme
MTANRARNLLFLWTDEQRPDTIAAYGNPQIRTPHLDRLAAGGTLFEAAYCTAPLCTPSRGSVVTGTYPHTHGARHNNIPLPASVPTVAEVLTAQGYRCGYAGKWHLGDELRAQRGFEAFWSSIEDGYTADHGARGFSRYHHWLVAQGFRPPDVTKDGDRVFSRQTAARLPEAAGKPAFLAGEACRFLDTFGREGPFALYVNFLEPHFPLNGPWDDLYPPEAMTLPPSWYAPPDPALPLRYRLRQEGFRRQNPHVETDDERGWKGARARYWGLASLVDAYAGKILEHLERLGLAEETVVVYSSDHGDMMGEHRLLAKAMPFDGASRVPLLIRAPGLPAGRVTTPVSQIDVTPTVLDLLGFAPPPAAQGASLRPLLEGGGGDVPGRRAADGLAWGEVVVEWAGVPRGDSVSGYRPPVEDGSAASEAALRAMAAEQRTIRRGRWKLTVDEGGEHELYDLRADPGEMRNRLSPAGRGADAVAAATPLWERLQLWQERTADALRLPPPV